MSSPVLSYSFSDANLELDSISGRNLTNTDVTLVNDSERGPVASFNGSTSRMTLPSSSVPLALIGGVSRTITCWVQVNEPTNQRNYVFSNGVNVDGNRLTAYCQYGRFTLEGWGLLVHGNITIEQNTWYHIGCVYNNSVSELYINGISQGSFSQTISTTVSDFIIGDFLIPNLSYSLNGFISDFRVYNVALNGTIITDLITPDPWEINTRSMNTVVEIESVAGASSYRLTYEGPDGKEIYAFSNFTDLNKNIVNLNPETQYIFRLYVDTGSGYELTQSLTTTTLSNNSSNHFITDFEENGVFDLTSMNDVSKTELSSVMDDLFETGDIVNVSVETKNNFNTSFVKLGDSIGINDVNGLLIPFDDTKGGGQSVGVVLSDQSTNVSVTYDDTNNTISLNSNVYNPGDVFILDGKKVRILDF